MDYTTDPHLARELDRDDELAPLRRQLVAGDAELIYLDGNSLGRLPQGTPGFLQEVVTREWGHRLVRAWNDGWIRYPQVVGEKIAALLGAGRDEVLVAESTSVNLFKLAAAALGLKRRRRKVVSDSLNFPSDLYILQGLIRFLDRGHRLERIPSVDDVSVSTPALDAALDSDTALLSLSHVTFKSGFLYDMEEVTRLAHDHGALVLWDLSHSVGAVPMELESWGVDLAVGCTYKYLNGGPGSPAFLYVRRELQDKLEQPLWGWLGAASPFDFDLDFTPAPDLRRFGVGTPPILSLKALEPGLDLVLEAGIDRLRHKSVRQSEYLVYLADQWLLPLGFTLGSPRDPQRRGSHVALRHPEAYRICRALVEPRAATKRVIPDFRTPDSLRLGIAPLYTTYEEIHDAMGRLRDVVAGGEYRDYSHERLTVT